MGEISCTEFLEGYKAFCDYAIAHDKIGKRLFSSTVIPNRGAWLEYETDSNDVFYVRVDRTRKVPITVLIRALGIGTNAEIVELFGEEPKILASFAKDTSTNVLSDTSLVRLLWIRLQEKSLQKKEPT